MLLMLLLSNIKLTRTNGCFSFFFVFLLCIPNENIQHPDKGGDPDEFRRVQQAYECLSDETERKWYDENRDAILNGWSGDGNEAMPDMLFQVAPFMHAGCYEGYDSSEEGFYGVYQRVFAAVYDGELQGRPFDPNQKDELDGLIREFGDADTPWEQVTLFYQTWESFASVLNFAWADPYDVTEAPNRRVKRAMDDENRKARKTAKKARNSDIQALVRFVKRRDPRVQARREALEKEKIEKQRASKEAAKKRKEDAKLAREEWREQAEEELAAKEEEDRLKGRVRLADLDDDYDYGGKKGKKGKKKKGKKIRQEEIEEQEANIEELEEWAEGDPDIAAAEDDAEVALDSVGDEENDDAGTIPRDAEECSVEAFSEESSEEESEPDIWRCDCCKKDFKSEGQMNNHLQSKKHKAAFKKYEAKLAKLEQEMMDELLDEED